MNTSNIRNQLLLFFRQMHFNNMPDDVMARFKDLEKNNDFTKNMEGWKKDLLNSAGNPNDLPDLDLLLTYDEWEYLYKEFRNAFRSMEENKESFSDDKNILNFFYDNFGQNKLFSNGNLSLQSIQKLSSLYSLIEQKAANLTNNNNAYFYTKILSDLKRDISGNLLIKIKTQTVTINDEKDIKKFLDAVRNSLIYDVNYQNEYTQINDELYDIGQILDQDKDFVNQTKIDYFRKNYSSVFKSLYSSKEIRNIFSNNGGHLIVNRIERAIGLTDYANKDSKDYLSPKRDDKLTFTQEVKKWKEDTYENYLEKYITLKGDRLFLSFEAKNIVKSISSAKIKPTDGLNKILEESSKIKDSLKSKSPKSVAAFEYFEKTMSEFKNTMPKAFNGSLKNGKQLRAIVSEMIISAIKNNKMHEAKVAMEILAIVRYGYTTSKTMNALSKDNFEIFSDKGLSWNKNEGVKYVTKAFDKTLKFATLGVGYGITALSNSIKRTGTKFKGGTEKLKKTIELQEQDRKTNISNLEKIRDKNKSDFLQSFKILRLKRNEKRILESQLKHKPNDPILLKDIQDVEKEITRQQDNIKFFSDRYKSAKSILSGLNKNNLLEKYKELVSYWDLVAGIKLDSFRLGSKKLKQKMFDKNKANFIKNWNSNYQMLI